MMKEKLNIVLVEPEIPQNTGNILRTCVCTGARLHLIRPLGFDVSEKALRRAGLDYWDKGEIFFYDSFEELKAKFPTNNFYFFTTKSKLRYTSAKFGWGDFLVFGKETKGLPETLIKDNYQNALRIPMQGDLRSLNLSNAVALTLYEAFRQLDFEGFNETGHLHDLEDIDL